MGRTLLAGLDVGTTSVKALLVTASGAQVATGRAPTTWTATDTGAQTDPPAITAAARAALADALDQVPDDDRVVALGVASMAESGVLVTDGDAPVAPVIAWHDHRDEAELDDLADQLGGEAFSVTTGLPLWTQWSLTKHRWLVDHVPEARTATRRYNVAEWVVRDLGGDPVTELSLASRTGWLQLATARPWDEALTWSGAPAGFLADVVTAGTPVGTARTDGPLRPLAGATLTVAGHDHQAAVVGVGSSGTGDELDSCGTAEAILRTIAPGLAPADVAELTRAGITVGWHAIRERWCLLGGTQGGLVLGRVREALGGGPDDLAHLDAAAAVAADEPEVLRLTGSGDVALAPGAHPGTVWRAATRAVAQQARSLERTLDRVVGPRRDLVVAGGWTHSTAVMAAKREALGPLRLADTEEAGARGAAFLAGLAHGTYATAAEIPNGARADDARTAS